MNMSERELEEIEGWYKQTEHYSMHGHRNVLQSYKFDKVLEEVRRSHAEAAELRAEAESLKTLNSDLRKARDRAMAQLREEENNRAWERTRAEELVMCKSHELAGLRERVESLEATLWEYGNESSWHISEDGYWTWQKDFRQGTTLALAALYSPPAKLENQGGKQK